MINRYRSNSGRHRSAWSAVALIFCAAVLIAPPMSVADEEIQGGPDSPRPADAHSDGSETDDREAVVVSATRIETDVEKVGSSVTVIDAEEIAERNELSAQEVLRSVPGVDVVRTGGPGGDTAVFMRGANSEHTLVFLDGIELNNPISTAGSYNFSDLTLDNVERIEVLRGPQSTLYGSRALGGVINIVTKRGDGPPSASALVEGGSYDTFREQVASDGGDGSWDYAVSVSREDSRAFSSAEAGPNGEPDAYHNTSAAANLGLTTDPAAFRLVARLSDTNADIDNQAGVFGDDPNRHLNTRQYYIRTTAEAKPFTPRLSSVLGASYADIWYEDNNDPDDAHPIDVQRSEYNGRTFRFDLMNTYDLGNEATFTFGAELEREAGDSDLRTDGEFGPFESVFPKRHLTNSAYYAQLYGNVWSRLYSAIGLRVDDFDKFGSEVTFRISPTLQVPETGTRFKGSVGTGFKAPSLYQLYSEFGREDLQAEESVGWDIGVEQSLFDKAVTAGVTYFNNDFDDLISFDPQTFIFENINEAESEGIETFVRFDPTESVSLRLQYTLTDTEDRATGDDLLRRARHRASAAATFRMSDEAHLRCDVEYVGKRDDNDFDQVPAQRVELDDYTVVGLSGSYRLFDGAAVVARVENLFDEEYEEVLGFSTPGASAYGGFKLSY